MTMFKRLPFDIIERPRDIGFVPIKKTKPDPVESPKKRVEDWIEKLPNNQSPPPCASPINVDNLEQEKKEYNNTYVPDVNTGESSLVDSSNYSPVELKLDELKSPLKKIETETRFKKKELERMDQIRKGWIDRNLPNPENWPRLKLIPNYDEDSHMQKSAEKLKESIKEFKRKKMKEDDVCDEGDEEQNLESDEQEAWAVIKQNSSEDNRFEASELIEFRNHEWCVAVRICKEKTDRKNVVLLVYSYQSGIQRLNLTTSQMDSLGETLLMKYRANADRSYDVLPIYSALPSTGLISTKYRTNKGLELRVYGVANFVDFDQDSDSSFHKTMIWTDAIGPIYISPGERANIRRKLGMPESKIFSPLRMCQLTVKGEFTSNVANGTFLKWIIVSFTPLIEEAPKDPNIGRNLWPARIIRLDGLVKEVKKAQPSSEAQRQFPPPIPTGTWLTHHSDSNLRVFCGNNLTRILNSVGPVYAERGIMSAYVIPCFSQDKFSHYEALIAGPLTAVMLLTEGRFLNYASKTVTPSAQKLLDEYAQQTKLKQQVREEPVGMKPPGYRLKSALGFEEFFFDF